MTEQTVKKHVFDIKPDLIKGNELLQSIFDYSKTLSDVKPDDRIWYTVNGNSTDNSNAISSIVKAKSGNWNGTMRTQVRDAINSVIKPGENNKPVSTKPRANRSNLKKNQCQFSLNMDDGLITFVFENDTTVSTYDVKTGLFNVSAYAMKNESTRLAHFASNPVESILNGIEMHPETRQPYKRGFMIDGYFSDAKNESDAIASILLDAKNACDVEWINKNASNILLGQLKPVESSNGIKNEFVESWYKIEYDPNPDDSNLESPANVNTALCDTPNRDKPVLAYSTDAIVNLEPNDNRHNPANGQDRLDDNPAK